jgi:hypothetical protein
MAAAWGDTNTLRKILSSYYDVMFVSLWSRSSRTYFGPRCVRPHRHFRETQSLSLHHAARRGGVCEALFLSVRRCVGVSICTVLSLNICYQDMSPLLSNTCLLSSSLSSVVSTSLRQFIHAHRRDCAPQHNKYFVLHKVQYHVVLN